MSTISAKGVDIHSTHAGMQRAAGLAIMSLPLARGEMLSASQGFEVTYAAGPAVGDRGRTDLFPIHQPTRPGKSVPPHMLDERF